MERKRFGKRMLAALSAGAVLVTGGVLMHAVNAADTQLVIFGDSISAGYGLQEGEKPYTAYLADCLGATVTNFAVSGYETANVLSQLQTEDVQNAVKAANVICMSVGSNDLLHPTLAYVETYKQDESEELIDVVKRLAAEGKAESFISGLTSTLREPQQTLKANLTEIASQIQTLNPDAQIMMMSSYNPFETDHSLVVDGKDYSSSYADFMDYVNGQLRRIARAIEGLDNVTLVDISSKFTGAGWIYLRDEVKDVHPNTAGHAMIAAAVLEQIENVPAKSAEFVRTMIRMPAAERALLTDENRSLMLHYAVPMGDLNKDGNWTAADADAMLKWLAEDSDGKLSAEGYTLLDVNGDGIVDILDTVGILKMQ